MKHAAHCERGRSVQPVITVTKSRPNILVLDNRRDPRRPYLTVAVDTWSHKIVGYQLE